MHYEATPTEREELKQAWRENRTYPQVPGTNEVVKLIKKALQRRSGKAWSVKHGRGTAYGWINIDAPPARCTWTRHETGQTATGFAVYEEKNDARPGHGFMSPHDRKELAELLGLEVVHGQGESIPASSAHYQEYIDRAEGRAPRVWGEQYWD